MDHSPPRHIRKDGVLTEGKIADSTNKSAIFNAEQSISRIVRIKSQELDRRFGPLKTPPSLNREKRQHPQPWQDHLDRCSGSIIVSQ